MARLLELDGIIIRINPKNTKRLDYSKNQGKLWLSQYTGTACGEFQDLSFDGKLLIAKTSNGTFTSRDKGKSWSKKP